MASSTMKTPLVSDMRNMHLQVDATNESWAKYSRGELTPQDFFFPSQLLGKDRVYVPHDKYEEDNEFPILDLSGCLLDHPSMGFVGQVGHGNDDELIAKKMVEAAEKWGFFGVMNHSVSLELITRLQAHARRFFNLPMEQKLKGGRTEKTRTGYVAGSPNFFPQKWWSEAMYLDWNPTQLQQFFERVWSQECDYHDIRADVLEYTAAMGKLAQRILSILAAGLGVNRNQFNRYFREESTSVLRINHYPPCPHPDKIEGLDEHRDPTLITILHQDDVGGLQILKDGKWVGIQPNPKTFIVNIGDILMMMSNERFQSVMHRAVTNSSKPRMSLVFACIPVDDDVITIPEKLVDSNHPAKFIPFTWKDFRKNIYCEDRVDIYCSLEEVVISN
ncbi:unnamed protein product [Sphagnum jensenii]|uniref:Fe2OG dioxygenase domain-containing protein n=1 Tax=Sphagnum jensenii TaxID=128206 RepID=A0ABP0VSE8_9BRYO